MASSPAHDDHPSSRDVLAWFLRRPRSRQSRASPPSRRLEPFPHRSLR
jgi:hypothetical protein